MGRDRADLEERSEKDVKLVKSGFEAIARTADRLTADRLDDRIERKVEEGGDEEFAERGLAPPR